MTRQRDRQASRRSPEVGIVEGIRALAEPHRPTTVQDWFVDGLHTLDVWVDVPADVEDLRLTVLLEDLRSHLAASFCTIRPPYGCSLVVSRAQQNFGSVYVDKAHPEKPRVLLHQQEVE